MKNWFKTFWQWADGNKTIILSVALLVVEKTPIPEPVKSIVSGILIALGATALGHHAYKGYFTTKKGN